jgi:hypothetical protein
VRVRHHGHASLRRLLDDDAKLLLGVDLLARIRIGQAGARGTARLDDVHAVVEVDAHKEPELLGRGHAAGERGEARVREDGLAQVGRDVEARGEYVRSVDRARAREFAECNVLVAGDARAAERRDPALERAPRAGERLDVGMSVDQPGQQVAAGRVDYLCIGRDVHGATRDPLDPIAADEDRGVAKDGIGHSIDDIGVPYDERSRRGGGRRR